MSAHYRATASEQERTADLMALAPRSGAVALDVGARDGYFSRLLADRFERVIALDLAKPDISHRRVECVQGDAGALPYADASIDFVLCTEVLEHIPPQHLRRVCSELQRVCRSRLLIGVPFREDTRVGRTTCYSCMKPNPPWGHVNVFDERDLMGRFPGFDVVQRSWVGRSRERSNALSCALMDWAGNPYGTYMQDEPCVHCGLALRPPPERSLMKKVATKLAFWSRAATATFSPARPKWIHLLLERRVAAAASLSAPSSLPRHGDAGLVPHVRCSLG